MSGAFFQVDPVVAEQRAQEKADRVISACYGDEQSYRRDQHWKRVFSDEYMRLTRPFPDRVPYGGLTIYP